MSTSAKVWLIIAGAAVFLGGVLFAGAMTSLGWDITTLDRNVYHEKELVVDEDFESISIDVDTTDITVKRSDDEKCKIEILETDKVKHVFRVSDNILTLETENTKKWYDYIGFFSKSPEITVYLPKESYSSLVINSDTGDVCLDEGFSFGQCEIGTDTGDMEIPGLSAKELNLATDTGDVSLLAIDTKSLELSSVTGDITIEGAECEKDMLISTNTGEITIDASSARDLTVSGDTGDIELSDTILTGKLSADTNTGDITFSLFDAKSISITSDTGDVSGSLLTDKVFITESSTGDINVPKTLSGGTCEITTSTGDIEIIIKS